MKFLFLAIFIFLENKPISKHIIVTKIAKAYTDKTTIIIKFSSIKNVSTPKNNPIAPQNKKYDII